MKNKIILAAILVILAGAALYWSKARPGNSGIGPENINFSKTGYISDREPEKFNTGLSIVYEEPGAPGLSVVLRLDENSICNLSDRDILCMALSVTWEDVFVGKRATVEGVENGGEVLVKKIIIETEPRSRFGFLRSVKENNQNVLIEIDEVEFLSGEEAISAGIEDTGCGRENISDCIPSMNNDFYIRNKDVGTEVYIADPDTKIRIFKNPGSPVLEEAALDRLVSQFKEPQSFLTAYPFKFTLDGAMIIELEEQYIP